MKDQDLVNALREHAEWQRGNEWETPITLGDDLAEAADRIANQNTHILALQKEIEGLRAQLPRWIPVTERLPEFGETVFATVEGKPTENITLIGALQLATLYDDGWCVEQWPEWQGAIVTRWMPLPEPPEEEM